MAYRYCISTRSNQLYQHRYFRSHMFQNFHEYFRSHVFQNVPNHDDPDNKHSTPVYSSNSTKATLFSYRGGSINSIHGFPRFPVVGQMGFGSLSRRGISGIAVNEVAVAAADSFIPIAGLQYLIDYVHASTGLNWWASIAAATFLIRWLTLPFIINQLKATSRLALVRPKLEEIKNEVQGTGMNAAAVAEGQAKMQALFKEHKVTPFTPLKGLLIQGPVFICFFMAVRNMAEKVPSFQQGGAYWFLDLTTPDSMYILPVLTALTFWITIEVIEGNPAGKSMKYVSRGIVALTVPLTASFPKAVFCYWISTNVFSLMYGLVVRRPAVKKLLGIPIIPVTPPLVNRQPDFSFIDVIKEFFTSQVEARSSSIKALLSPAEAPKLENKKPSSAAVVSPGLKSLEKEVKGKKKGKKRR